MRLLAWLALAAAAVLLAVGCSSSPTAAPAARPPAVASAPATDGSPGPSPAGNLNADPSAVIARSDVPVLCYHQIRDQRPDDSASSRAYIMPPATFRAELDYLAAEDFHPISADQLFAHLATGAALPAKPVLLTFDDSDESQFTDALPSLLGHHFPATFFIMTVVLGKPHYMDEAQLRQLVTDGMTIGGHTWDHHRVDRYSGDDWRVQIEQPTAELERIVGQPLRYFAYPFGVWNPTAFDHLRSAGYRAAFQLNAGPMDPSAPVYTLRRAIANPSWNTAQFAAHLTAG